MTVHRLSRADARRVAVRAQLLDSPRPTELLEVVRRLSLLQIDPTAAIVPSADLVAWSRLGSSYSPAQLAKALEDRTLVELRAMIRPGEDLALYRADMAGWESAVRGQQPGWRASRRDWVRANDACRLDILQRLRASGPLTSRELPDTCQVPWRSSGWTNNRNVTQLLEGAAVTLRPADPRPRAHPGAVRVRLLPGDVQARGQAPLGVLRPADPVRRPAGGQARRHRRPRRRGAAGQRRPPGRGLRQAHGRRGGRRDPGPGRLAPAGPRRPGSSSP